jgi:hypothetical protein
MLDVPRPGAQARAEAAVSAACDERRAAIAAIELAILRLASGEAAPTSARATSWSAIYLLPVRGKEIMAAPFAAPMLASKGTAAH